VCFKEAYELWNNAHTATFLIEQTKEKSKLATKKLIERELDNFDEEQLAQILNFIALLKLQHGRDRLPEKNSNPDE
jgi:hypothetical protein